MRQLLVILISILPTACTTNRTSADEYGLHIGSHLVLKTEGVAIPCVAWEQSGGTLGLRYSPNALCFEDPSRAGIIYPTTPKYSPGAVFIVDEIKHINRFDWQDYLIYSHQDGATQTLAMRGSSLSKFFGVKWHANASTK